MHNLSDITFEMKKLGFSLHIETSGAYPLSGKWDWITLSPKKRKPPMEEIYLKASELKVVIFNDRDFLWAQDQEKKVSKKCLLYLQPEWNKFEKMKSKIFNFISENPRWRLSLQMHKYLHIQ